MSSSAVFLSDVDDYLGPSQACVNPLFTITSTATSAPSTLKTEQQKHPSDLADAGLDDGAIMNSNVLEHETRQLGTVTTRQGGRRRRRRLVQQGTPESFAETHLVVTAASSAVELSGQHANLAAQQQPTSTSRVPTPLGPRNGSAASSPHHSPAAADDDNNVVRASLADCLACSGCVTTAETVLLEEQHSLDVLRHMLGWTTTTTTKEPRRTALHDDHDGGPMMIVMTISPASWADWNRQLGIPMGATVTPALTTATDSSATTAAAYHILQRQWTTLLHQTLQVEVAMDGNVPLEWSLQASTQEFCTAYRNTNQQSQHRQPGSITDPTDTAGAELPIEEQWERQQVPSRALSSTETMYRLPDGTITTRIVIDDKENFGPSGRTQQQLPLLAASCPAVVCLAEKSIHGALPHLSTIKSPMAMAGAFWKGLVQKQQQQQLPLHQKNTGTGVATTLSIFHLAVMPCHDKKLEASRPDFVHRISGTPVSNNNESHDSNSSAVSAVIKDIDMVLTTMECLQLIQEALARQRSRDGTTTTSSADGHQHNNNSNAASCTIEELRSTLLSLPPAPVRSIDDFLCCNGASWSAAKTSTSTTGGFLITSPSVPALGWDQAPASRDRNGTASSTSGGRLGPSDDAPFVWGSGGYAQVVFVRAAQQLFGVRLLHDEVQWKPVDHRQRPPLQQQQQKDQPSRPQQQRSARVARQQQKHQQRDFYEAVLYRCSHRSDSQDGVGDTPLSYFTMEPPKQSGHNWTTIEPVLRFAIAYGMQTIHRVLDPLMTSSNSAGTTASKSAGNEDDYYHYVEVMACPAGCLNGGGQGRWRLPDAACGEGKGEGTAVTASFNRETPSETRQRVREVRRLLIRPACDDVGKTTTSVNYNKNSIIMAGCNSSSSSSNNHRHDQATKRSPAHLNNLAFPMHTRYHAVPPLEYSKGAALSGVAVKAIQW